MAGNTTDLDSVKQTAIAFLYIDIQPTDMAPVIITHPFFTSGITALRNDDGSMRMVNITENKNDLAEARRAMEELIMEQKNAASVFSLVRDSFQLAFFKHVSAFLSDKDYGELLAHAWTTDENANNNVNVSPAETIRMFKKAKSQYLMTDEERTYLANLPEEFAVYRGANMLEPPDGFSWSTERRVGEWFAKRFDSQEPFLYKATAAKKDVLAYFSSRDEYEVVVDWRKLKDVEKINLELTKNTP